jgi:PII-like signaling protein
VKQEMTTRSYQSKGGKRLRLFIGEAEVWQGKPLYQVVVEHARQHGIRGATVLRGIEGFGPEHHLSTERLPDIAENLPLIIEMVDSDERIEMLLPVLDRLMQRGMITVSPVEIILTEERAER